MPIISKETWDKFTQEEKEKIRKKYQYFHKVAYHGAMESYETLFPEEALHPQPLTYEDVARELFKDKKCWCNKTYSISSDIDLEYIGLTTLIFALLKSKAINFWQLTAS